MITPDNIYEAKTEIKKSRFLGKIIPVSSETEVKSHLEEIRSEHRSANHHCWACVLWDSGAVINRFSDGGEPSGTAGKPILESLQEKSIVEALIIVTRYFGGIKLGTGGLSRAYRECARYTIAAANFKEKVDIVSLSIKFDYPLESQIRSILRRYEVFLNKIDYTENIGVEVTLPAYKLSEFTSHCMEITAGKINIINKPL